MAISEYLRGVREQVGHDLVLLPAVSVLIWGDDGQLLLMREAQTGRWQTVGGGVELGVLELDPLNRHLLVDAGVLSSLTDAT